MTDEEFYIRGYDDGYGGREVQQQYASNLTYYRAFKQGAADRTLDLELDMYEGV